MYANLMTVERSAVGALILRLRKEQGLTQGQVAAKAGVKRSWLSHVELGRREKPEREMLEAVAAALRVPAATLLAPAGYRVTPIPIKEERSLEDILREAQVAARRSGPIEIPLVNQRAAAGYLGGGVADVETLTYLPATQERGHSLIAIRVSGDCLEPRLMDGHIAIVDQSIDAKQGDIVLALHEGEAILKELRERDGRPVLAALKRRPIIPVNEDTRVVGVVIDAQYRVRR